MIKLSCWKACAEKFIKNLFSDPYDTADDRRILSAVLCLALTGHHAFQDINVFNINI